MPIIYLKGNLKASHPQMLETMDASAEHPATYNSVDHARSIAGGAVSTNIISTRVDVLDGSGNHYDIIISFGSMDPNQWVAEVYVPEGDQIHTVANPIVKNQFATGSIYFDGNGQLIYVTPSLCSPIAVLNDEVASTLNINWGAINGLLADGISSGIGLTQINSDTEISTTVTYDEGEVQEVGCCA